MPGPRDTATRDTAPRDTAPRDTAPRDGRPGLPAINDARLREILTGSPTIAVLGIHHVPEKAAFYVPEYLHQEGYRVIGVNPQFAGETLFGEAVRATLAEIAEPIDLVDVFRRAEAIPAHLADLLAMQPLPKVVWFQLGIRNDEVAETLEARGVTVIQNRCTLADHQRLGLGAPRRSEARGPRPLLTRP